MKNSGGSGKWVILLVFLLFNAGAIFVISRFFEISWAILAISMVFVLAIIDLPGMIRNRKIKKAQRKAEKERLEQNKKTRDTANQKAQQAKSRQRRMTERNIQNRGGRR